MSPSNAPGPASVPTTEPHLTRRHKYAHASHPRVANHQRREAMTKEELIAQMANSAGITKVAATVALEAFTGAVTTSLKKGKRVTLVNFGTFTISKRKARMGRNPRTGEALKIPAARIPKFSAGKELKAAVK
ncbi:MAG TPA: HU family DNA-binding protein [Nitrospira sp.]|nr:HU family DNA-binding protein [Nitrospira sp.]HMV57087.1 HU family DNA-binding protein [Nitrospira sp.]HMW87510.1 HU family DNA-binding protein [Nitrospira sp.]HMX92605.1 HU family DNA-binding protein [Nitrospira sp.]HMZ98160.1 HU family DNA-binding protein [Nitrospira sp.]